jgi:outer membrane murein-binding lipoprotein Lpp
MRGSFTDFLNYLQEIQDWKDSTLNAIHDCLDEVAKQQELKAENDNLKHIVDELHAKVKQLRGEKELAHAELAEASLEIDRLQDNIQARFTLRCFDLTSLILFLKRGNDFQINACVQALVNENLDYEDKTKNLEAVISSVGDASGNKRADVAKNPTDAILDKARQPPVKLVLNITSDDAQAVRAFNAETRVLILWHHVAQLQVRKLHPPSVTTVLYAFLCLDECAHSM